MYLLGQLKGEFSTLITIAAMDWDDIDPMELDFSDVYNLIKEKIDARERDIRGLVEPDDLDYPEPPA